MIGLLCFATLWFCGSRLWSTLHLYKLALQSCGAASGIIVQPPVFLERGDFISTLSLKVTDKDSQPQVISYTQIIRMLNGLWLSSSRTVHYHDVVVC